MFFELEGVESRPKFKKRVSKTSTNPTSISIDFGGKMKPKGRPKGSQKAPQKSTSGSPFGSTLWRFWGHLLPPHLEPGCTVLAWPRLPNEGPEWAQKSPKGLQKGTQKASQMVALKCSRKRPEVPPKVSISGAVWGALGRPFGSPLGARFGALWACPDPPETLLFLRKMKHSPLPAPQKGAQK